MGQLTVEDLGNCSIEATADNGTVCYLIIKTDLGVCNIMQAGPFKIGSQTLLKSVNINFQRLAYNENKLQGIIAKFLNNPSNNITQAREINEQEVYINCINILEYIKNNKDFED